MRRLSFALTCLALAACGKKDPAPPAPTTAPPPPATTSAPTTPPAPEADAAAPTPEADAAAPTAPAPEADAAAPTPAGDGAAHLVWTGSKEGYTTAWVGADGQVVATRPQAAVVAGGTLWGIEPRWVAYRETSCEDFERGEEAGAPKATPGPKKHLPWLVAKGLAGAKAGDELVLAAKKSDYFFEEPNPAGEYNLVGEHWGRTVLLEGGGGDVLLVSDCEGGYGCGAHGDWGCGFTAFGLAGAEVTTDLKGAATAIEADTKAMIAEWTGPEDDEVGEAELVMVSLLANGGEPKVRYRFAADVPYSGTSGDWGSYTQSRDHVGAPVPALGLGEIPAAVKAQLAGKPAEASFGWSVVPTEGADALLAAFKDAATLPGPAPADEAPAAAAGDAETAAAKVNEGRKLTREKKHAEAIVAFDAAIALDAKAARAWSGRGYAKLLTGDLAGARADFEQALTLDAAPKFQGAVHFNLGELAEKEGDPVKALAAYKKADELAPSEAAKKRIEALGPK